MIYNSVFIVNKCLLLLLTRKLIIICKFLQNKSINKNNQFPTMQQNSQTKIIKNKIYSITTDYSHIQSRLFSSLSKSKSKQKNKSDQLFRTVRQSLQKVQQIGQNKYKQAMKHMNKFNKYEEQKNKRRQRQNEQIMKQCTFEPKINKNKSSINLPSSMFKSTISSLYGSKKSLTNFENLHHKKPINTKKNGILIQQQIKINQSKQMRNFVKKSKPFQTAQRLINWSKNRDSKIINKAIDNQVNRSISRESTYSNKDSKKSSNSKAKTYNQLHMKKINLSLSMVLNQSQQQYYNQKYNKTNLTPKTLRSNLNSYTKKSSNSLYFNSTTITPRAQTMNLDLRKQQKTKNIEKFQGYKTKTQQFMPSINPQKQKKYTYGQKLLAKQGNRGQQLFYLRQARSNILKNYQKTDILIQDKKYSKNFSIFNQK